MRNEISSKSIWNCQQRIWTDQAETHNSKLGFHIGMTLGKFFPDVNTAK